MYRMNWPAILYHGTSSRRAERIIKEGIVPNASPTPWPDYPGMEGRVSITVAYAWYYAAQASGDGEGDPCVVQIKTAMLDPSLFRADDDVLGQMVMHRDKLALAEADKVARTEGAEGGPMANIGAALASLECIGSLSFNGTIPPEAIIQAVALSPASRDNALFLGATLEPTITALNYRVCGEHYRALTEYPFTRVPVPSVAVRTMGKERVKEKVKCGDLPAYLLSELQYDLTPVQLYGDAWHVNN